MKPNPAFRPSHRHLSQHPLTLFLACLLVVLLAIAVATAREDDNRQQRGGQHGPPPPEEVAKHIMAEFDDDKNGVLDLEELTASIKAMHERNGPPGGQGGQGGRPGGPPPRN